MAFWNKKKSDVESPNLTEFAMGEEQEVPKPIARVPWQTYVGKLFKRTNILDPILPMLDSTVWDESQSPQPRLKDEHRIWIFEFVTRALHSRGYTHTDEWLSLVLTGSLTTYQYSPGSDCDISLFISVDHLPDWSRAEMIGIMTELCDGTLLPGTSHPLQCYVVDPEFKKEDLYQPGLRSGYDINENKWIVPPEKARAHDVKQELNSLYVGALEGADKMERLLRYEPDKAVMYYKQIHSRRKRDMEAGKGDYSSSNIIYKMLEARDLLDRVHDLMPEAKAYDSGDD
jgi:hypothetical protein